MVDTSTVTDLLDAVTQGDTNAAEELWQSVHLEVRQMAAGKLAKERPTANLQPTLIVNEVYMRIWPKDKEPPNWEDRRHFFGCIARVMEQFLIDYARARGRLKRGGDRKKVSLTMAEGELRTLDTVDGESIESLVAAIRTLETQLPRAAEVIRLRYISGLTIDQVSDALEISSRTVVNDWEYARAWLRRELTKEKKQ